MSFIVTYIKLFLKKHAKLRKLSRSVYIALKKRWYATISKSMDIDDRLVIFECFMGRQYACNPRAIYEYMINEERFNGYKFVWVFKDFNKKFLFEKLERAEVVLYESRQYYNYYASAKYVVTNSNIDYTISKKKGQVFLQTWHGTPLKKLRCDISAKYGNANNTLDEIKMKNDIDVIRYDYFLSPSAFASDKFISAFNLKALGKEEIVVETGYPRNDLLINYNESNISEVLENLGINKNKKIILYAPTFRDNQHEAGKGYVYDLRLDFDKLNDNISDEYIILFRAHYFVANQFDFDKYKGFVYDVSDIDDITQLYLVADMLVTDYSSVFFDYANLKRPILFYMYDLDEYYNDIRGFYMSVDELPGQIIQNEEDLIYAIKNMDFVYDEKYKAFNEKYNYLDDGKASERIVDIMIS